LNVLAKFGALLALVMAYESSKPYCNRAKATAAQE
jgi:hypothetical protein